MVWVLLDKTLPGSSSLIEMVWSSGPFLSCLRLQKKKKVRRTFYIFSQLCLQVVSFSFSSFLHETLSKGMQQFVFQLQFLNGMGNIWAAKKFESNSGKVSRIPFTVFYSYYNIPKFRIFFVRCYQSISFQTYHVWWNFERQSYMFIFQKVVLFSDQNPNFSSRSQIQA